MIYFVVKNVAYLYETADRFLCYNADSLRLIALLLLSVQRKFDGKFDSYQVSVIQTMTE